MVWPGRSDQARITLISPNHKIRLGYANYKSIETANLNKQSVSLNLGSAPEEHRVYRRRCLNGLRLRMEPRKIKPGDYVAPSGANNLLTYGLSINTGLFQSLPSNNEANTKRMACCSFNSTTLNKQWSSQWSDRPGLTTIMTQPQNQIELHRL